MEAKRQEVDLAQLPNYAYLAGKPHLERRIGILAQISQEGYVRPYETTDGEFWCPK